MNLLDKNIERLRNANPLLLEKLKAEADISKDIPAVMVQQTRSLLPTVSVQKNGHKILMHSMVDPAGEAARFISTFEINSKTKVVFIFGLGFGYHVSEVLRKLPEEARVFVIEKDEKIINQAMKHAELSFLEDSRVHLFCGDFDTSQLWRMIYHLYFPGIPYEKNIIIVSHFPSFQLYPDYYKHMAMKIRDYIARLAVVINTHVYVSTKWPTNTLLNVDEYIKNPDVQLLFNKNKNKPAIVVSAGPSLNKNIELLRDVQNKALIVAVGTSLKPLLKKGIIPHIVVAIDADEKHYHHFRGVKIPKDVAIVYDPMIYPQILDDFPGVKFTCNTTENPIKLLIEEYFGKSASIESGFSVATAAFTLACLMGSNPVIFVGQDLAYGKDGHSHAAGTTFENHIVQFKDGIPVQGNDGEIIYTTHVFLSTLRWFEEAIAKLEHLTIINATEGGAKINGTQGMSLREAMAAYCREDVNFCYIHDLGRKQVPSQNSLREFIRELREGIKEVKRIREMCRDGAAQTQELLDKVLNNVDENSVEFQKKAFVVQKLVDDLKVNEKGTFFLDSWMQEVYIFLNKTQQGIKELSEYSKSMQEINRAGVFIEGLLKASFDVLPLLEGTLKKSESILKEFYGKLDRRKLSIVIFTGMEDTMMMKYIYEDCIAALREAGHEMTRVKIPDDFIVTPEFYREIMESNPDFIFTLDNHGLSPAFVQSLKVPVVSFFIDDPHLKTPKEMLKRNYFMFMTEYEDAKEFRDIGFSRVYPLQIGSSSIRFYPIKDKTLYERYLCDVSFVALSLAGSYEVPREIPEKFKPYLDLVIEQQSKDIMVTLEKVLETLGLTENFVYNQRHTLESGLHFVVRKATALHRIQFLKRIPKHCNFKLYGDEGWKEIFPEAPYCGRIDYGAELINVYNASKINLGLNNYGLLGLHSRVLDMALCKAFGLFEYTPGLAQYFTNKEDVVWFKTPEEMAELIDYYLAHPEERQRIAENAYKTVLENFTFKHTMKKMLDIIIPEL